MIGQLAFDAMRPTRGRERVENVALTRAFQFHLRRGLAGHALEQAHDRPPSAAARRLRARNNRILMLLLRKPSDSAISSCEEPCAYASQSISRSRGLSPAMARAKSVRCSVSAARS